MQRCLCVMEINIDDICGGGRGVDGIFVIFVSQLIVSKFRYRITNNEKHSKVLQFEMRALRQNRWIMRCWKKNNNVSQYQQQYIGTYAIYISYLPLALGMQQQKSISNREFRVISSGSAMSANESRTNIALRKILISIYVLVYSTYN